MILELETVLTVARSEAREELPQLLDELETVRAVAWSRLTLADSAVGGTAPRGELLDVDAARKRCDHQAPRATVEAATVESPKQETGQ